MIKTGTEPNTMIQEICRNWLGVCIREVSPVKKKKKGMKLNKPKKASNL